MYQGKRDLNVSKEKRFGCIRERNFWMYLEKRLVYKVKETDVSGKRDWIYWVKGTFGCIGEK